VLLACCSFQAASINKFLLPGAAVKRVVNGAWKLWKVLQALSSLSALPGKSRYSAVLSLKQGDRCDMALYNTIMTVRNRNFTAYDPSPFTGEPFVLLKTD